MWRGYCSNHNTGEITCIIADEFSLMIFILISSKRKSIKYHILYFTLISCTNHFWSFVSFDIPLALIQILIYLIIFHTHDRSHRPTLPDMPAYYYTSSLHIHAWNSRHIAHNRHRHLEPTLIQSHGGHPFWFDPNKQTHQCTS